MTSSESPAYIVKTGGISRMMQYGITSHNQLLRYVLCPNRKVFDTML